MFDNFDFNVKNLGNTMRDIGEKIKKHPGAAAAFAGGVYLGSKGTIGLTKDVVAMFAAKKLAKENEAKAAEVAEVYDPENADAAPAQG